MPIFEVQNPADGKTYEVDAPTLEAAASAFGPSKEDIGQAQMAAGFGDAGTFNPQDAQSFFRGVAISPGALAQGGAALVGDIAEAVTPSILDPDSDVAAMNATLHAKIREARAGEEKVHPGSLKTADIVAGLAPVTGALARGANLIREAGWLRGGLVSGTEGAVAANVPYQEKDQRGISTALGFVLPQVAKLVGTAGVAFTNVIQRQIARRSDQATQKLLAQAQDAFVDPNTGQQLGGKDDYFVAQAAGDPRLARLSQTSIDTTARDAIRTQLDQRIANVDTVIKNMGGPQTILNDEARAAALYKVVDSHDLSLRQTRNGAFTLEMGKLAMSPEGRSIRVPLADVQKAYADAIAEFGNPVALAKDAGTGKRLGDALDYLDDIVSKGSGKPVYAKLQGLVELQQGINAGRTYGSAVLDPKSAALQTIRNRLQTAINGAIAKLPANAPGVAKLQAINKDYAVASDGIRRFDNDALTKLFGDTKVLADPDSAFDAFVRGTPSSQRLAAEVLGTKSPELLRYFRQRTLDNMLNDSMASAKAASESRFDVSSLVESLQNKKFQQSPIFTTEEKKWARGAAADLRVILNSNPSATKIGTNLPLEDLAINLASRNPAFISRYLTRVSTGLGLENLLFTKAGRDMLSTARNFNSATGEAKAQMWGTLSAMLARENSLSQADPNAQP